MSIDRSGLSRGVRSNPYGFADVGSLDTIVRQPARNPTNRPSYDGKGFAGAIQDISAQYPSRLTQADINKVMSGDFGGNWDALYDSVTGNTAQARFQAAGGGIAGRMAALGLTEEDIRSFADVPNVVDTTGAGGGAGAVDPVAYAKAINDYIASVDAGRTDFDTLEADLTGRFAGYGENIASASDAAIARQDASAARAAEALAAIDPQAAFQFNVDPASMGSGAALGYLESIGASTAGVEGLRDFEQSLLNQALTSAQQFSAAQQSALDIERAARQAAVPQILQESQGVLEANRLAATLGLSEEQRRALEALLLRESGEEQSIANNILNARLMAAEAGVTL
jgi:hypothetical protein